ncbi:MAG: hypothetical protein V4850_03405 [Myxococcota bacterium]
MRFLPLLLLAACFDSAETSITIDVKSGTTHVVQRMHNAWPDTVGCGKKEEVLPTTEECVAAVKLYVAQQRATLESNGATVAKAGILVEGGNLDILYDYTAPAGSKTMTEQGLSVMWARARTQADVAGDKQGKKQLLMAVTPNTSGNTTVTVDGKYKVLEGRLGDETHSTYVLGGKTVTVVADWWYASNALSMNPGPWLDERAGLAAALAASSVVVVP